MCQLTSCFDWYGVATISRLLKIIGLFCRISSLLQASFAKETHNFEEPTSHSQPIVAFGSSFAKEPSIKETIFCKRDL